MLEHTITRTVTRKKMTKTKFSLPLCQEISSNRMNKKKKNELGAGINRSNLCYGAAAIKKTIGVMKDSINAAITRKNTIRT